MIVCPNCNHSNPDGAQTCEACYTPLPATTNCPSCGATVQTDASFCGQCGFNLKAAAPLSPDLEVVSGTDIPDLEPPEPLVEPQRITVVSTEATTATPQPSVIPEALPLATTPSVAENSHTQLQQQVVKLLHVQTNTTLELPQNISVVHIGKPNDKIPPDIDVSGFPNSEIVSRIHADIRVEGDGYFVEDVGSSNGTYINSKPLQPGDRHRLRKGDRIALGKGDLMTFLFQS